MIFYSKSPKIVSLCKLPVNRECFFFPLPVFLLFYSGWRHLFSLDSHACTMMWHSTYLTNLCLFLFLWINRLPINMSFPRVAFGICYAKERAPSKQKSHAQGQGKAWWSKSLKSLFCLKVFLKVKQIYTDSNGKRNFFPEESQGRLENLHTDFTGHSCPIAGKSLAFRPHSPYADPQLSESCFPDAHKHWNQSQGVDTAWLLPTGLSSGHLP